MTGFVEAPESFLAVLRELDPDLGSWDRVIFELPGAPPRLPRPAATVRRLAAADADAVAGLAEDIRWIAATLGGPVGLARSELAWGAFDEGWPSPCNSVCFRTAPRRRRS